MNRPDFIIIGAMKCGTTTLAAQLGAQTDVFMTTPKEPNFFSDDAVYRKGDDWYADLFNGADAGQIKGEASTHYTKLPTYRDTLDRMTRSLDRVRLVYMIRDPMVRLVSHYIHEWSQAVLSGPLSEALDSHQELIDYGRYGYQLQPYVEAYGRDAICLTSLERLKRDKGAELQRIADHIGATAPVEWIEDLSRNNVSSDRARRFPAQELLIDNPVAQALRRALVPKSIRTRIRASRQMQDRPEIPAERLGELHSVFLRDRDLLADLFPNDPSLTLAYPFAND